MSSQETEPGAEATKEPKETDAVVADAGATGDAGEGAPEGNLFLLRLAIALGPLLVVTFVVRPGSKLALFAMALGVFAATELVARAISSRARDKVKNLTMVFGLVSVAGVIASLVLTSFQDATVYAMGVDRLVAEKGKWTGRQVRVEGILVKGSLRFREVPCEYTFDATKGDAVVHVRYPSCIKPDTLRDDMPEVGVTAEGKLQPNGEFVANNVLAKCPSKYEMKDNKAKPNSSGPTPGAPPPPSPAAVVP